jgi:predicted ATPase
MRATDESRANLPLDLTSFIGRERQLAELHQLLMDVHLLTLTGAGGVGKTRLALRLAAELVEAMRDGVWLVELAALQDAHLVPQALAATLDLRHEPGEPLHVTLQQALHNRELLLVLDNCEHLAQIIDQLVANVPHARLLELPVGHASHIHNMARFVAELKKHIRRPVSAR